MTNARAVSRLLRQNGINVTSFERKYQREGIFVQGFKTTSYPVSISIFIDSVTTRYERLSEVLTVLARCGYEYTYSDNGRHVDVRKKA